jgi:hypothetical protein
LSALLVLRLLVLCKDPLVLTALQANDALLAAVRAHVDSAREAFAHERAALERTNATAARAIGKCVYGREPRAQAPLLLGGTPGHVASVSCFEVVV